MKGFVYAFISEKNLGGFLFVNVVELLSFRKGEKYDDCK